MPQYPVGGKSLGCPSTRWEASPWDAPVPGGREVPGMPQYPVGGECLGCASTWWEGSLWDAPVPGRRRVPGIPGRRQVPGMPQYLVGEESPVPSCERGEPVMPAGGESLR